MHPTTPLLLLLLSTPQLAPQRSNAEVCGYVTNLHGDPIEGATVKLRSSALEAKSDSHGAYCLHGVVPGTGKLVASSPGFYPSEKPAEITTGGSIVADFALRAGRISDLTEYTILGRVKDLQGGPVIDARVRFAPCLDANAGFLTKTTQIGEFVFQTKQAAQYCLQVWTPTHRIYTKVVVLRPPRPLRARVRVSLETVVLGELR